MERLKATSEPYKPAWKPKHSSRRTVPSGIPSSFYGCFSDVSPQAPIVKGEHGLTLYPLRERFGSHRARRPSYGYGIHGNQSLNDTHVSSLYSPRAHRSDNVPITKNSPNGRFGYSVAGKKSGESRKETATLVGV